MRFAALHKELAEKIELQLPNGSVLRSRQTWHKGRFWQSYSKVVANAKKKDMPLVGCLSSGTDQHLFAYDFDEIPEELGSWDRLIEVLEDLPGFTVARSPSGKVKAFIVFNWSSEVPNRKRVIEFANDLLPDCLKNRFDPAGAFQFYLSKDIADALSGLSESLVYDWRGQAELAIGDNTHSNIVCDTPNKGTSYTFSYHLADESSIPVELEQFINRKGRGYEGRLKFCRILVAMFRLADKGGFGLPVASLAEQCGTNAATVSGWLRTLKNDGFLSCVSHSYIVGLKAKHYEARGALLKAIKARKETYNYAAVLPRNNPKDGEFYRFFLHLSKKIPVLRDFKLTIESLPGIKEKGRYDMALRIFKHDRNKESRS